jgi:hypothetical protein
LSFTLASCTEIYFSEPQPKGIKSLDNGFEELIGEYISFDENEDENDTVIITKNRIQFSDEESMDEELSETFIVKKYKSHFFINFYDAEKDLWQLVVAKTDEENSLHVTNLMSIDEDNSEDLSTKRYARKVEDEDEDDYIVMNPSRRQLMKLIDYPIFDENKLDLNKIKIN